MSTVDTGSGFITGVEPAAQVPPVGEPPQQQHQQPPQQQGRFFSEADVERIRQEEAAARAEVTNRLSSMDSELQALRQEREAREAAQQAAEQAAAEAERQRIEAETDVRSLLTQKETEWESRFSELQAQRERDQAIFEQERRFAQLEDYRRSRVEQEAQSIMPQLRDLVHGSSIEEIEASIEDAKRRSDDILADIAAVTQQQQRQQTPLRGAAPTGQPPVGPMEAEGAVQSLSTEDIARMSPAEYGKHRDALMRYASQQRNKQ